MAERPDLSSEELFLKWLYTACKCHPDGAVTRCDRCLYDAFRTLVVDGERLQLLENGFFSVQRMGPSGPFQISDYSGMGEWRVRAEAPMLRVALDQLRAARQAQREGRES